MTIHTPTFDVIIIGGSYAGLSAAMALGRSLRSVLIIDSGLPCNRTTPHSHNFLTQDGKTPAAIAAIAREQVLQYDTVQLLQDTAVTAVNQANSFHVQTAGGTTYTARKLLFATGITDLLPQIPGLQDCWGRSVIHCPYCHGYEYRDVPTGIFATAERAMHLAGLVRNLTRSLTILTSGGPSFTPEQTAILERNGINTISTPISSIVAEKGQIEKVIFEDDTSITLEALYAAVPFVQHTDLPVTLGCELTETGHLKTDNFQRTTIAGVFACGDNSNMMRSVAAAVASGSIAGAMANAELVQESL